MALSYEQYSGTGSRTQFDFSFEYLSKTHVKASVNGVDRAFTWNGTYSILITPAPAAGSVVEVRRTTPRVERLVRFTDGSTLVASDLNVASLQPFFLSQEAFDQGAASMAVTEDGQYSAQTRRVTNLGDPVNGKDAVTKDWALNFTNTNVSAAVAAKDAAVANAASALADRILAQAARDAAVTARAASEAARDSSSGHRLNAQNAQNAAVTAQGATEAARDVAVAARDVTTAARDVTITYRNEGQAFRNQAEAFAAASDSTTRLSKAQNLADLTNPVTARSNLKIWTGTLAAYNALATKDAQTIYIAT